MRRHLLLATAIASLIGVTSCTSLKEDIAGNSDAASTQFETLLSFDNPSDLQVVSNVNSELSIQNGALLAKLNSADNFYSGLTFQPDTPIDMGEAETVGFSMEIGNLGDESVQLNLDIKDSSGAGFTRSAVVPANSETTYYTELKGPSVDMDSGLRDDPSSWTVDGTKFTWMWGQEQLDTSEISSIALSVISLNSDRTITLDDLQIVSNPKTNPLYLDGIVDRYGQNAKLEFPGKVHSDRELAEAKRAEEAALNPEVFADRSKYNGWKAGPQLDATGYFRSEKVDGKWALVDPEGYLFFSNGIANIRMSNTSTMTGRDYPPGSLVQRSADDITPEDSLGLNPAPKIALPERYLASEVRRNMFNWLPDPNDPLSDHYGYRREVHSGPMNSGETYSFYRANLERKYGEESPESFMRDWADMTLERMEAWGFTSFGNWVDPIFYDNKQVPYFANGWIIGDYKTVSSGDDLWAPLPDPFDPKFTERANVTVQVIADEVKNSPWCVGVFIDNEKSWGRMGTVSGQYGIAINTLARDGSQSPTKAVFTQLMKDKYGSISALNEAWGTSLEGWQAFDRGVETEQHNSAQQADYAIMLEAFASEYFRIVSHALDTHMPNYQYMGVRFASWGMTPEVIAAAAKYVDVMSVNEYREVPQLDRWEWMPDIDKPVIIGEFHNGSTSDTGLFHAGLVKATDQADRGRMYKNYLERVIENPYLVGAHWFQYIDSPITGRAYDGENYNVGLVTVTDLPYPELVQAAKEVNLTLYDRRYGNLK